ncbi:MAG: 2-succinyl-6-hydroxy-2,4-cyclohexadiene-1-carboxylate synthase [Cyanobacteria bacterium J06600_6]
MEREYQFNYVFKGDRSRPVILFLHGFMGDCRDFEEVIARLPEFCCLAIDLPGHGRTEVRQDSDYQMENIAVGLIELLTELEIEQCFLVGYSMGGRIALYLTVNFPQFWLGTILESASPGLATQLERDRRIIDDLQLSQQLVTVDFAVFLTNWYANPLFKSFRVHPNYQQAIARRLQNNPLQLAKSLQHLGLGKQPSLWSDLAEIKTPLLLVVGSLDQKFLAINQTMFCIASQACLNIVEDTGHNIHFEQTIKFCQLLQDFLRECL